MHSAILTASFFVIIASLSLNEAAFCAQKIQDPASWSPLLTQLSSKIPSDRKLAKGKFLVAARKLRDPNFFQTVVLLIEYDPNGAMGVIINQPTERKLSKVFAGIKELQKRTDPIFLGGPVMQDQLLLLVRTVAQPEGSLRVFQNVYVASQLKLIEQMIKNEPKGDRFRVYAGYAGWGPGQLDREIKRDDWYILPADADTVFNKAPSEIWPELIHRSSLKYVKIRGNRLSNNSFPLAMGGGYWEGGQIRSGFLTNFITPTQTFPRQGGRLLVELQGLLDSLERWFLSASIRKYYMENKYNQINYYHLHYSPPID